MTTQNLPCEYRMDGGDTIHVAPITLIYGEVCDSIGLYIPTRDIAREEGEGASLVLSSGHHESVRLALDWPGAFHYGGYMSIPDAPALPDASEIERLVREVLPGVDFTHPELGGGAQRLIHIFARTLDAKPWLICIDEPAIHLHPVAQRLLARALHGIVARDSSAIHADRPNKRLLMSTMSEQFIVAFLALVAEGKLAPDDLAIYHMSYDERVPLYKCAARYERQAVHGGGQVPGGLRGFAESEMEDMKAFFGLTAEAKADETARIRRVLDNAGLAHVGVDEVVEDTGDRERVVAAIFGPHFGDSKDATG